jgi:hypothetical protein
VVSTEVVDRDGVIHCDPECCARQSECMPMTVDADAATEVCRLCCRDDDLDPDRAER